MRRFRGLSDRGGLGGTPADLQDAHCGAGNGPGVANCCRARGQGHDAKNYASSGTLEAPYDISITYTNLQRLTRILNNLRNWLPCHPEEAESLAKRVAPDEGSVQLASTPDAASKLQGSFGAKGAPQDDNDKRMTG